VTEVQALIGAQMAGSPRRTVSGLDSARLAMVLAVLERRAQVKLHDREVFAATVGGMRVVEPAADLALALAVASSRSDIALPRDLVVLGEIGLAGEVRRVAGVDRRLAQGGVLSEASGAAEPLPYPGARSTVLKDYTG